MPEREPIHIPESHDEEEIPKRTVKGDFYEGKFSDDEVEPDLETERLAGYSDLWGDPKMSQ